MAAVREAQGTPVCSVTGRASSSVRTAGLRHHGRVGLAQRGRHRGRGGLLRAGQVGGGVQLAAQPDGEAQLGVQGRPQRRVQLLRLRGGDHRWSSR
jgi:hypothetical protein